MLVGQSWGAILAALYTAEHPDHVAGLVLSCPGPLPGMDPERRAMQAPGSLHLRQPFYSNAEANAQTANLRTAAAAWLARNAGLRLMPDAEADAFQSILTRLLSRSTYCDTAAVPGSVHAGSGYYAQLMTMRSLQGHAYPWPRLRRFQAPVLILKGQCDNQPWGVTAEYSELFSHSRLVVVPGAGHNIFAEQPEAYRAAILRFLDTAGLRY